MEDLYKQTFGQVELDCEAMVLSCMIGAEEQASAITELIDSSYFYPKSHQVIFDAIKSALEKDKMKVPHLNQMQIYEEVEEKEDCPIEYFLKVADFTLTPIYPEGYLKTVINSKLKRLLLEKNNETLKEINQNSDVQDIIDNIEENIEECKSKLKLCSKDSLQDQTAGKTVKELMEKSANTNGSLIRKTVNTGYPGINKKSFLEKGEVTFLAARPGMGK